MQYTNRVRRRISPGLRREVFVRANGQCQRCHEPITESTFHCAHLRADSHGGPPVLENLEAWCIPCNLANGNRDAADTRVPLRDWQREARPVILEALTVGRVATLMAAPGAGKTLFAAAVFAAGQDAGLWDRLVVFVPRLPLVKQWAAALLRDAHIALDTRDSVRQSGYEMPEMDGIVTTYQSVLPVDVRRRYRHSMQQTRTLLVLDEVHHLGEPLQSRDGGGQWARAIREIAGDVETELPRHGRPECVRHAL